MSTLLLNAAADQGGASKRQFPPDDRAARIGTCRHSPGVQNVDVFREGVKSAVSQKNSDAILVRHSRVDVASREEILRTTSAFYVQSVNLAICFGPAVPLSPQSIGFELPCDERTWTLDEQSLRERLSAQRSTRISFRRALHWLLKRGAETPSHLQGLSSFAKDTLGCGILETIINEKSNPLSYASFEDYQNGNLSAISTRGPLLEAASPSHPDLEGAVMLRFAVIQLNRLDDVSHPSGLYSWEAALAATEVFCSIAKSGFQEVRMHSGSFGPRIRHCVVECAKAMTKWLGLVMGADISDGDTALLVDIREALTLNDMGNAMMTRSGNCTIAMDVQDALFDTWSELFGSRHWAMSSREAAISY